MKIKATFVRIVPRKTFGPEVYDHVLEETLNRANHQEFPQIIEGARRLLEEAFKEQMFNQANFNPAFDKILLEVTL